MHILHTVGVCIQLHVGANVRDALHAQSIRAKEVSFYDYNPMQHVSCFSSAIHLFQSTDLKLCKTSNLKDHHCTHIPAFFLHFVLTGVCYID